MSRQRIAPGLVLGLVASVTAMVLGAGRDDRTLTALAAVAFVGVIAGAAFRINADALRSGTERVADSVDLMRRNIRLAALVYVWGAAAMLAIYSLSGLEWRHGWQYGFAMALIAAGFLLYVRRLGTRPAMPPLALTALHGTAAFLGLIFLAGTGKLSTPKDDWAANDVFLSGGVAIVALCLVAGITQVRLSRAAKAGT